MRPSTASSPNLILDRLSYTAPILAAGQSNQVTGSVNYQTTTITERGTPPNIPSTVSPLVLNAPDAITIHQAGAALPAPVHPPAPTPDPVVPAPQPVPTPAPVINFYVFNVTVNLFVAGNVTAYAGPVGGLQHQLLMLSADNLNITATAPNSFIHTGSGTDAIDVSAIGGNNVLDGGTGSNFLTAVPAWIRSSWTRAMPPPRRGARSATSTLATRRRYGVSRQRTSRCRGRTTRARPAAKA